MKNRRKKELFTTVIVIAVLFAISAFKGTELNNTSNSNEISEYVSQKEYTFANENLLNEHFEKHGKEMGFKSAQEYEKAASDVVNNPAALYKAEKEDGDGVYYVEATNEFVIVSKTTGYIRSYYYPTDGKAYFDRQ